MKAIVLIEKIANNGPIYWETSILSLDTGKCLNAYNNVTALTIGEARFDARSYAERLGWNAPGSWHDACDTAWLYLSK